MKPSRSGYKIGIRDGSNERKSSIGADEAEGLSPYPKILPKTHLNQERSDQAFRNGANVS